MKQQWSWLSWVLVAIIASASLLIGVIDNGGIRSDAERASDVANTIRCPQCVGQSVAESDVPIARAIRAEIAEKIDEGQTDEEIRQSLVDVYTESILLTPAGTGLVGLIWVIPVVAAALGAAALGLAFARWRGELRMETGPQEATEADIALVAAARAETAAKADEAT